jgi:hypothetical protein
MAARLDALRDSISRSKSGDIASGLLWAPFVKVMRPHSILVPTFLFAATVRLIYVATLRATPRFSPKPIPGFIGR